MLNVRGFPKTASQTDDGPSKGGGRVIGPIKILLYSTGFIGLRETRI